MTTQPRDRLDMVLNAATVVVASVLLIVALAGAHRRLFASNGGLSPGADVTLSGGDWKRHGRTLVLALQPDCSPTEASLPFYLDLLASIRGRGIHPVLVTPHAVPVARQMAKGYGLAIDDVRSESFETLGVPGSPTLLLVDGDGRLVQAWIGRLSATAETSVFDALDVSRIAAAPPTAATAPAAPGQRVPPSDSFVLDIRSREETGRSPVAGAATIPLEELEVRLIHEVPQTTRLLVVCSYCVDCQADRPQALASRCDLGRRLMTQLGYGHAEYVGQAELDARRRPADAP